MSTAPYIPPLDSSRTDAPSGLRIGGDWALGHYARLDTAVLAPSRSPPRGAAGDLHTVGAPILAHFGAGIYTGDLVSFSFLGEFGVLLAPILMAGRTGSAFTAQIGS